MGVRFLKRGIKDEHVIVKILSEDDEYWSETDVSMSSYWIDDLISALQSAKDVLNREAKPDPSGFGWQFKG